VNQQCSSWIPFGFKASRVPQGPAYQQSKNPESCGFRLGKMTWFAMNSNKTSSPPLLDCRNIGVRFGGVVALQDVDFDIRPGEVHGLVGCNGAGKSTLMKVLAGVVPEYTGEIHIDGRAVRLHSPREALAQKIAMVYQELSGIGALSVAENLCLGRQPTTMGRIDWSRMNREAAASLAELDIHIDVRKRLDTYPLVTRQMVEIARGLHSGARILILDEPTSALSLPEARRLFELIGKLKTRGVAMVFISHFLEDVLAICDRVTILRDGRRLETRPAKELDRATILHQMVGEDRESAADEKTEATLPAAATGSPRLSVRGLCQRGHFDDITLDVKPGECLGLYGFVGAGHQDLVHAIAGATRSDTGEVCLVPSLPSSGERGPSGNATSSKPQNKAEEPLTFSPDHRSGGARGGEGTGNAIRMKSGDVAFAVANGVVLVAADRAQTLSRRAPIAHNVTLAHLKRVLGSWIVRRNEHRVCQPLLERVGCRPPNPALRAGSLSGGNQQKVVLAKWLLGPINVLLLEEPTRGMDVHAKAEVMELVAQQKRAGAAIILASTEPELILAHADRIVTFARGRITREFTGARVTKQDLMHSAEEGDSG
jgi:ribose transport system ATP-binding protein